MCARRGPGGSSRAVHLRSVTSYGSAPIVRGSRMRSGHLRFGRMVASDGSNTMNLEVMNPIRSGQQLILHDYMVAVE